MFMAAWRDNEREVALTRLARQAEKRVSTLPAPALRLSCIHIQPTLRKRVRYTENPTGLFRSMEYNGAEMFYPD